MKSISITILLATGFIFVSPLFSQIKTPAQLNKEAIKAAEKGETENAISLLEQAAKLESNQSAVTFNNLGFAYEKVGNKQGAIKAYLRAIERNDKLVQPLQNAGKLYYDTEDFRRAIEFGERTIKLDPQNREVISWLPDAYQKDAQRRLFELQNGKIPSGEQKQTTAIDPITGEPISCKTESKGSYTFGIEMNARADILHSGGSWNLYKGVGTLPLPMKAFALLEPAENFSIYAEAGKVQMGLGNPNFIAGQQLMEFIYKDKAFSIGAGMLFNHLIFAGSSLPGSTGLSSPGTTANYLRTSDVSGNTDVKFGIIGGANSEKSSWNVKLYPRYLIKDTASSFNEVTFDYARLEFNYRGGGGTSESSESEGEESSLPMSYSFKLHIDEVYLTEHNVPDSGGGGTTTSYGHYFGRYDLGMGIVFGNLMPKFDTVPFEFGAEYVIRMYLRDLDDANPAAFGNGQGYFGLDTSNAASGSAFPGMVGTTHMIRLFSRQLISEYILLGQSLAFEMAVKSFDRNNFFAGLTVGIRL
jgi:tetratricopeptide (TPR) repeat protein